MELPRGRGIDALISPQPKEDFSCLFRQKPKKKNPDAKPPTETNGNGQTILVFDDYATMDQIKKIVLLNRLESMPDATAHMVAETLGVSHKSLYNWFKNLDIKYSFPRKNRRPK